MKHFCHQGHDCPHCLEKTQHTMRAALPWLVGLLIAVLSAGVLTWRGQ